MINSILIRLTINASNINNVAIYNNNHLFMGIFKSAFIDREQKYKIAD